MIRVAWTAFAIVMTITVSSMSAQTTGDQFLWRCTGETLSKDAAAVGEIACLSYLGGLLDATSIQAELSPQSRLLCLPAGGISADQARRVVVKWLKEHPKDLHNPARTMVFAALREAFPCRGR